MKKIIQAIVLLATVGVCVWLFFPKIRQKTDARVTKFNEDAENLINGLQQYKEFVGSYPPGNSVDIAKALTGQTDKKILILAARKNELNAKGEIVDSWGTPLQIYFSQNGIMIRSAGPNKVFEDSKNALSDDLFRSS